ncbi:putative membrane protein [Emiliania huxleyi virus 18]|nr:putative membrane protein [Emiliania huxleyi virus 18]
MVDIATIKKKLEPYKMIIIVGALVGILMYWHHVSKNTEVPATIIGVGGYTGGYNPDETANSVPVKNYNADWVVNYYSVAPSDTTTVIASSSRTFMDAKYINLPTRFTDEQCIAACKQEKSDFANIGSVMPGVDRSCNCYKTSMQCIKYNGISNGVQKYMPRLI